MANEEFDRAFVGLLTEHQPDLHLYIRSLLPDFDAAADALQETNTVLWTKRYEFELGSNFCAWAFAIARFKVMAVRRDSSRQARLFSEELMQQLADSAETREELLERRRHALAACLQRLSDRDRNLITLRYQSGVTVQMMSQQLKCSIRSLYKAITKIRRDLLRCIEHRLAMEEHR